MTLTWHLEQRNLSQLRDHPRNPRHLTKTEAAHLKDSIQRFGLIDKPICNTDNTLVGGHQRKRILKECGYTEIECWIPSRPLTDSEIDELCIRLNRNTGSWDYDILANEWDLTHLLEWGFKAAELDIDTGDFDAEECTEERCETCGKKKSKGKRK